MTKIVFSDSNRIAISLTKSGVFQLEALTLSFADLKKQAVSASLKETETEKNFPGSKLLDSRKLLLVRTDRIGDMLVTTPCIRAVRHALPQARIDMLASAHNVPAIEGNPWLEIFSYTIASIR